MKEKLNIAALLKEKPENTKLYSLPYGECYLKEVRDYNDNEICVADHGSETTFYKDGKICKDGEALLFPSKNMQDWSKFAWKKGDVLTLKGEAGTKYCIFEAFENDEYTLFKSRFACSDEKRNSWLQFNTNSFTKSYEKASDEEANEFIKKVEEHYDGKLNLNTLEIEKQPKFKDGDIVHMNHCAGTLEAIFIFKSVYNSSIYDYASLMVKDNVLYVNSPRPCADADKLVELRPATESEKQQLFDALAKEDKKWNPETLQIEDLPKKYEFKPMDWCLMRMHRCIWRLCQYSSKSDTFSCPHIAVGGNAYEECIPYNDQTKHLLGTTDEWKGGEG